MGGKSLKVAAHWAAGRLRAVPSPFSQLLDKDPPLSGGEFGAEVLKSS